MPTIQRLAIPKIVPLTSVLFVNCLLTAIVLLTSDDTCVSAQTSEGLSQPDLYKGTIQPFVDRYCLECHCTENSRADLDFTKYSSSTDLLQSFRRWQHVTEFIRNGEMPPEDSLLPSISERNAVVGAIRSIMIAEAEKHAGDPGIVGARRLSNSEYNYSILDLTGVDIQPTRDFPVDPSGGEGFDNTAEALGTSPNLVKKYLAASQLVADHLVLQTDGIRFAPYPVTSYNERTKLTEGAILKFYEEHSVDYQRYVAAAWRYRYRSESDRHLTLDDWAAQHELSSRYLRLIWHTLSEYENPRGVLADIQRVWQGLAPPIDSEYESQKDLNDSDAEQLEPVFRLIELARHVFNSDEGELIKANAGNWPISHLDFRARTAEARDRFQPSSLDNHLDLFVTEVTESPADQPDPQMIFLRIDPLYTADQSAVILERPLLSRRDSWPANAEEEKNDGVISLRAAFQEFHPDALKTLPFGKPLNDADGNVISVDGDSIVVSTPALIAIPMPQSLRQRFKDYCLMIRCRIHAPSSIGKSISITVLEGEFPASEVDRHQEIDGDEEFLILPDSPVVSEIAESSDAFCQAFPNRYFYADEGRGLSAGFHLVEGFFRDDAPLVKSVLSDSERAELDQLWRELHFVTESAETLLRGFVWFERSEREVLHDQRFDFLRSEDPDLVTEGMLGRFERLYLDKLGVKRIEDTLQFHDPKDSTGIMVHKFFEDIRIGLREHERALVMAEERGLEQIEGIARKAWRRSLSPQDSASIRTLYQKMRADGLGPETSLRGLLISILMAPDFCFLIREQNTNATAAPLSGRDVAVRLSYALWSSIPDDELLALGESGQLLQEDTLRQQILRMQKDPRIERFAREFFGQWLRYRDYLTKDPILASSFEGYDDRLRESIFEEPTRVATKLIQNDESILSVINGDSTFVNERLARHYGGEIERQFRERKGQELWTQVSDLKGSGRGGWPGMAIVLAKNSAGDRTSPVKRGFWAVHHLLGQHFPPPPADVPELPKSEKDGTRTIREALQAHVADAQCAMCHRHFDGLGIAMEGFDAIGRTRTTDLGGRAIDNTAEFPDQSRATGIPGLIDYITLHRQIDFTDTFCRKFVGYLLGRSVQLSDEPLIEDLKQKLMANNHRFSVVFEGVIFSPQFLKQRGDAELVQSLNQEP